MEKTSCLVLEWAATWQNQQSDCAPSEDSDQPGHPPSLSESSLCAQWVAKDPSFLHADSEDWADAQADLSLRWAHTHFVGFVMSRLNNDRERTAKPWVVFRTFQGKNMLLWQYHISNPNKLIFVGIKCIWIGQWLRNTLLVVYTKNLLVKR